VSEKPKKAKKGKKGAAGDPAAPRGLAISVSAHPTASYSVRRARAWGGLAGFAIVLLLSLRAGVPEYDALLRALAGGMVAHFGAWFCAVALWRRLVLAELDAERVRREQLQASPE
jgi:hypothetical protein